MPASRKRNGWGTPEEQYRRACLVLLSHRYRYYVMHSPTITDTDYDALERALRAFEATHPELLHPQSPTQRPGSERPDDYPLCVVRTVRMGMEMAPRTL